MDFSWSIIVLNFEFMLVLNHDDVTWDCPKRKDLGKRGIIRHIFLEKGRSCKYFVV